MDEDGFALEEAHVCVIGLGLMGGSLAMALRGQVSRLSARDVDTGVLQAALKRGVIDEEAGPVGADIIVLAAPPHRIVEIVPGLNASPGALVIDLGSTKVRICAELDRLPEGVMAVGGHPMCGLAENGFRHAIPDLYQGARFVLCETARTTPQARLRAETLVRAVGATPLWMDRHRHDELTALTSHLPHLLSFALMSLAIEAAEHDSLLFALAAGGFDGATRLARTDESMLVGMFGTNAANIRNWLSKMRGHIDRLEAMLEEEPALEKTLREIVQARRAYTERFGERPIA